MYTLTRLNDGLINTAPDIRWLEFDFHGRCKAQFKEIKVGRGLILSPFTIYFTWQTTLVTEIIEQRENYIKFQTKNSIYELTTTI
jgi:hypothetical protein